MKHSLPLFLLLIFFNSYSQISNDSLLSLFKNNNSFEIFESLRYYYLDYNEVRKDERLKEYFIKCLDEKAYFEYNMEKARKNIEARDLNLDICFHFLNKNKIFNRDSILGNPDLYKVYRDSTVDLLMKIEERKFKDKLPFGAVWIHSQLKYPESYDFVKKEWIKKGKPVSGILFKSLLRLNDPEAIKIYEQQVNELVKNNAKNKLLVEQVLGNIRITNSRIMTKALDMLSVSKEVFVTTDFSEPLGCYIAKYLLSLTQPESGHSDSDCKALLKDKKKIKEIIYQKAEELKQEEKEWGKNINYSK